MHIPRMLDGRAQAFQWSRCGPRSLVHPQYHHFRMNFAAAAPRGRDCPRRRRPSLIRTISGSVKTTTRAGVEYPPKRQTSTPPPKANHSFSPSCLSMLLDKSPLGRFSRVPLCRDLVHNGPSVTPTTLQ